MDMNKRAKISKCEIYSKKLYAIGSKYSLKSNMVVYITCFNIDKLRCNKYDLSKERMTNNEVKYFYLEYSYINFDNKVFEEIFIELIF